MSKSRVENSSRPRRNQHVGQLAGSECGTRLLPPADEQGGGSGRDRGADAGERDDSFQAAGARAAEYRPRVGGGNRNQDELSDNSASSLSSGDVPVTNPRLELSPATRNMLSAKSLAQLDGVGAFGKRPTGQQPGGGGNDHDEVRGVRFLCGPKRAAAFFIRPVPTAPSSHAYGT